MASIIKADNIQKVSDGSNIIKKCGSTITLGSCGATIALACGASQTGFGQTYSATEYCTTVKTAPFTAVAGKGYFINTTCAAVTVTLPASPTAGDIVSFKDYAGTFATNNVTLCRNGSKVAGSCLANPVLDVNTSNVSLIYVDATKGWLPLEDNTSDITGTSTYITATGGSVATCGDYKIHTFTSDGTFCVSAGNGPFAKIDYLVIAGGGSGSRISSPVNSIFVNGGGGAGGYRESHCATVSGSYTASPLATPTSLQLSVQAYPVTVGGGGASGSSGSNSIFNTITSAGGGAGGISAPACSGNKNGANGGSGGGGYYNGGSGGSGNTPPVSPPQGNNGGDGVVPTSNGGGGGGGATAVGSNANPGAGPGGAGATSSISTTPVTRAGGGGGGSGGPTAGSGGSGGGGAGAAGLTPTGITGTPGTANTGGGAGGNNDYAGGGGSAAATGGSGIVIIRYKYQ